MVKWLFNPKLSLPDCLIMNFVDCSEFAGFLLACAPRFVNLTLKNFKSNNY
jgi:hypothetical protein